MLAWGSCLLSVDPGLLATRDHEPYSSAQLLVDISGDRNRDQTETRSNHGLLVDQTQDERIVLDQQVADHQITVSLSNQFLLEAIEYIYPHHF